MARKRRRDDDLGEDLSRAIADRVHREIRERVAKPRLPDGIITLVFTDVEGSSALIADLGEEAARATLRRHDAVVREMLPRYRGTEVERVGDSFMLAFRTASEAIEFALALNGALEEERWDGGRAVRVRTGIDTGEVISEERGYFGAMVVRAARIADLARGGEVLVSEVTRSLASSPSISFTPAGEHELKGLGGTHPLYDASVGDGTSSLPA